MSIPVRMVVIGAGHLGRYHLDKVAALQAEGLVQLVAVVDTDHDARTFVETNYRVPTYSDCSDLQSQHVDAAIVSTPTYEHARLGIACLERGWHVLVEKPIAANTHDATSLVGAASRSKRILQVGHSERFNPALRAALSVLRKPRYIVTERLGPFSGRSTDVDVVLDLMIHDLDLVAALVPSPLVEVRAVGVPIITDEIDMASVRLAFEDGTVAELSAGRASLEPSRKFRAFSEERYLSVDSVAKTIKSVRRVPSESPGGWPQISGEPLEVGDGDALMDQCRAFVNAIVQKAPVEVNGAAGLRALELAEAVKSALFVPHEAVGAQHSP